MRNWACVCVCYCQFWLKIFHTNIVKQRVLFCKNLARLELSCAPNFGIQWGMMERFPLGVRQFWIEISVTPYTTYRSSASYLNSLNVSIFTCKTQTTLNLWCCCKDWINHWLYGVCVLSCFSCVQLFVTVGSVAHQAPLSMGFSKQEYWSGLPHPAPGDLPNTGIKPASLMPPALAGRFFTTSATWEAHLYGS